MRFPTRITLSLCTSRPVAMTAVAGWSLIYLERPIRTMKALLVGLGLLSAVLIVAQLVMGLLIRNGQASLRTAHFHSGSLMVLVTLAYIALSLSVVLSRPRPEKH